MPGLVVRAAPAILLTSWLGISIFYRARADRLGGALPGRAAGSVPVLLRSVFGVIVLGAVGLGLVAPERARWASAPVPEALRWAGLGLGFLVTPFVWWTLSSLGLNVSPTTSARANATLVTRGPYRWIRHPLYSGGFAGLLSLGVLLGSGPLLLMIPILLVFLPLRARQEEEQLIGSFGQDYRDYRQRTGRFLPRIGGRAA